jgi:hypothetical protein
VSVQETVPPVAVFQRRMQRSALPPPVASRVALWLDQASAFTAALCPANVSMGAGRCGLQTCTRLSLPPDARSRSLCDHFRPHTCAACKDGLQHMPAAWQQEEHPCSAFPCEPLLPLPRNPPCSCMCMLRYRHTPTAGQHVQHAEHADGSGKHMHLAAVAQQLVLEVFGRADVMQQDAAVAAAGCKQVAAPGGSSSTFLVAPHQAHPTCSAQAKFSSYIHA